MQVGGSQVDIVIFSRGFLRAERYFKGYSVLERLRNTSLEHGGSGERMKQRYVLLERENLMGKAQIYFRC